MKISIKNLTNSPYKIGNKMLPARGELHGVSVASAELMRYKALGYFAITETEQKDDIDALREKYKSLSGESPDGRWSAPRLKSEIGKIK